MLTFNVQTTHETCESQIVQQLSIFDNQPKVIDYLCRLTDSSMCGKNLFLILDRTKGDPTGQADRRACPSTTSPATCWTSHVERVTQAELRRSSLGAATSGRCPAQRNTRVIRNTSVPWSPGRRRRTPNASTTLAVG